MNEQKKKYQMDVDSGYPEPWALWLWRGHGEWNGCNKTWGLPFYDSNFEYTRLPNADQIILEWQKAKYAEDAEWHPRPWELWEHYGIDGCGGYKWFRTMGTTPGWYPNVRYRRLPDASTREQWEAEHGVKVSEHFTVKLSCDKCATCRHTYEAKQRTIHIEADLPEPMREEPKTGDIFFLVCRDEILSREWGKTYKEKVWFDTGLCHAREADAQAWLEFFKQWRSDK